MCKELDSIRREGSRGVRRSLALVPPARLQPLRNRPHSSSSSPTTPLSPSTPTSSASSSPSPTPSSRVTRTRLHLRPLPRSRGAPPPLQAHAQLHQVQRTPPGESVGGLRGREEGRGRRDRAREGVEGGGRGGSGDGRAEGKVVWVLCFRVSLVRGGGGVQADEGVLAQDVAEAERLLQGCLERAKGRSI